MKSDCCRANLLKRLSQAKNDVMDPRAIWMAVQHPGKSVPAKSTEQQAILVHHKMHTQLVKLRTAQSNVMHGVLLEQAALNKPLTKVPERLNITLPPFFICQTE